METNVREKGKQKKKQVRFDRVKSSEEIQFQEKDSSSI